MENRPVNLIVEKTDGGYELALEDVLTGSCVGFGCTKEGYKELKKHFLKESIPKNTSIVDRSLDHNKDSNVNNEIISDFSFRMGAMWMKKEIIKNT